MGVVDVTLKRILVVDKGINKKKVSQKVELLHKFETPHLPSYPRSFKTPFVFAAR